MDKFLIPEITIVWGAIYGLLLLCLVAWVLNRRVKYKITEPGTPQSRTDNKKNNDQSSTSSGDEGILQLSLAQRAHGNSIEYTIYFIIASLLAELAGANFIILHIIHIAFLFGRCLTIRGILNRTSRRLGLIITLITTLSMIGLSLHQLVFFKTGSCTLSSMVGIAVPVGGFFLIRYIIYFNTEKKKE